MAGCEGFIYEVKSGDTIVSIARKYGVKLADLIVANSQLSDPTRLAPGDEICIPLLKEGKPKVRPREPDINVKTRPP